MEFFLVRVVVKMSKIFLKFAVRNKVTVFN